MSEKLNVAVIGCGNISVMHLDSVIALELSELVAVCDIKAERANAVAEKYQTKAYTDYKEMIARENLDVVQICLPHYLHTGKTSGKLFAQQAHGLLGTTEQVVLQPESAPAIPHRLHHIRAIQAVSISPFAAQQPNDGHAIRADKIKTAIIPITPAGITNLSIIGIVLSFPRFEPSSALNNPLNPPTKYAPKPIINANAVLTIMPCLIAKSSLTA